MLTNEWNWGFCWVYSFLNCSSLICICRCRFVGLLGWWQKPFFNCWFTFSSFQGPQSQYLIHSKFYWTKRWGSLEKVSTIEATMAWNRGIPFKILNITHNYLIFWFYCHFLVHFLIISRSRESTFDSFKVFLEWGERVLGKKLSIEVDPAWNREIPWKI